MDGNLTSTISYISVAGKQSVLKNMQMIDIPEAIDITGATRSIEEVIDIKKHLPDGVIIPDTDTDTRATLKLRIIKSAEEDNDTEEEE